ncbi:hypothetical protein HK105_207484 [Polyrhizophydium stewartii]|uniref:Ras guanine nucleotide exchange factor n=1 Tax=Polyrhizophydium stewartii TaxID=2732419 RepID=A0ABR4N0I2_9FUNG
MSIPPVSDLPQHQMQQQQQPQQQPPQQQQQPPPRFLFACVCPSRALVLGPLRHLISPEWDPENPEPFVFRCPVNGGGGVADCSILFDVVPESDIDTDADTPEAAVPPSLAASDAAILFYDVCDRLSFFSMPSMLDILRDMQIPAALLGCNLGQEDRVREVDYTLGSKLASVFDVTFMEMAAASDAQRDGMRMVCQELVRTIFRRADQSVPDASMPGSRSVSPAAMGTGSSQSAAAASSSHDALKAQLKMMRRLSAQLQHKPSHAASPAAVTPPPASAPLDAPVQHAAPAREAEPALTAPPRALYGSLQRGASIAAMASGESVRAAATAAQADPRHMSTQSVLSQDSSRSDGADDDSRSAAHRESHNSAPPVLARRVSDAPSNRSSASNASFASLVERRAVCEGCTFSELVERMTSADSHDVEFTKIILMLYPKFMRPSELLDRLVDRFDEYDKISDAPSGGRNASIHPVQLRVCNVLIHWVSNYWQDFNSEKMRFTLLVFLDVCSTRPAFAAVFQRLSRLVFTPSAEALAQEPTDWGMTDTDAGPASSDDTAQQADPQAPQGLLPVRPPTEITTAGAPPRGPPPSPGALLNACRALLDCESTAIAQQLCLMEWDLFKLVKASTRNQPRDLVNNLWSKSRKGKHTQSVMQGVQLFNEISSWVASAILAEAEPKARARVIAKFIRIAQALRMYNNYNSLIAVIAGINSSPIARLKHTLQHISDHQIYAEFKELEDLMSSFKSFARYRVALKQSSSPCIPYLGMFLRDLLYNDESHKDFKPDGTVNLHKFLLIGDVILMINNFQIRPYEWRRNAQLMELISGFPRMSEEYDFTPT